MPRKKKATKKDAAVENITTEMERVQLQIPKEKLGWLMYLNLKEESAKKDVSLAQFKIREYMHEHQIKLQHLRAEEKMRESMLASAKEERENFMAEIGAELGISDWSKYAVREDGVLVHEDDMVGGAEVDEG